MAALKIGPPSMTFLPIVERELRVAARRRGTYGMRLRIAGAATLAFAVCFMASQLSPLVHFGSVLSASLTLLCMLYCLSAGRLMTADCLSREKREGTLGLLFLTDLKGYDVVLGKLFATSLNGFYGLLAVFPLLAIPLLSGGMTNGELWRMALVLVNTFLFSLAIGLFVSAVCRDEHRAMAANFGLILLLAAVPPALEGMRIMSASILPMTHEFFYSCPVYSLWQCADGEYKKSPIHFWSSIGVTFDLTVVLVLLACRIAPQAWQDNPLSRRSWKRKSERRWRWWREGKLEKAHAFRQKLLGVNAYFWLAARPYLKASYVWTCMVCMGIWWVFTTLMVGHNDDAVDFGVAFLLNGMLKLWIITEAGHQLAEDKRARAFELLLSTPLTVADIVRGQWLALRRQFLKPVAVAIIFELVLKVSVRHFRPEDQAQASYTWVAGILMLVADMFTLGWFAMSAALTEKSHDRATLKTATLVLALPWVLFGAVTPATYFILLISRIQWEPNWTYYLGWWFGLGIFLDLFFLLRARRRVQTSFRQLALESPAPKTRFAWLHGWRKGSPERKIALRVKLRRLAIPGAVLLAVLAVAVLYTTRAFRVKLPDPVVVSISQSNHLTRVFPGQGGFLFILPDGSLWRWVHSMGRAVGVTQPRRVGTNHNWAQASLMSTNAVAVASDGTLWAWRVQDEEPRQFGADHDWEEARTGGGSFIIARKRDGTLWTRGNFENVGNGPSPNIARNHQNEMGSVSNMAQIGTNHNWKAIKTGISSASVIALRSDGTLWTWGNYNFFTNGIWSFTNNPFPIQVCHESNWVAFNDAGWTTARNEAGECWSFFPFRGLAGADVSIASIGQLVSSNSAMTTLGPFFNNNWNWGEYEIQPGGTMWVAPVTWPLLPPQTPSFRFGQRSDWSAVWGGYGTLMGLTSDGALWTWGIDYGQERHYDIGERIDLVRASISNASGASARPFQYDEWQGHQPQKEPRPLMRIVIPH